ncbi:hypothetical protein CSC62_07465 [Pseudoxanthomonas jiangsuensis]|uniref:hypothetical protein n=1 Tax=Pseudoxanthomonas jiangsuensis TaxID=619688 RepID=UPI00139204B4|nr:hypothetical protein [Pseudoxanthomonas jiangsuensis]KAF1697976.1 hypothetical protein CSC62_07465 [Pseudoxanthomonas jiangsuensis]
MMATIRDTRWMYPGPRPTEAARRAMAAIRQALADPPTDRAPADMLAELEQRRLEDEARRSAQGVLPL